MARSAGISKSLYCSGVQCPKTLWLKTHHPEFFDTSVVNQSVFTTGSEVGSLARGLFGSYAEVKYADLSEMLRETEKLITSGENIIAEASFSYDGLFCSVDLLKNLGEGNVNKTKKESPMLLENGSIGIHLTIIIES